MEEFTYQRVADADDVDDAVVVRIWHMDGEMVGEADAPAIEDAQSREVTEVALGNPVPVRLALANAREMLRWMPFDKIYVEINDDRLWLPEWGTLIPLER